MVDHVQMIRGILELKTSYYGAHYTDIIKISGVDESPPTFLVMPNLNKFGGGGSSQYISEFFNLILKADTLANLETMISTILGVANDAANGYNISETITLTDKEYYISAIDDDVTKTVDGSSPDQVGVSGKVSATVTPIVHLLRFRTNLLLGATITNAELRITSYETNTQITPVKFAWHGVKDIIPGNPRNDYDNWKDNLTTKVWDEETLANFTKDTEYILTTSDSDSINEIVVEIMEGSDFDIYLALRWTPTHTVDEYYIYAKDIDNTNPTKEPVLELDASITFPAEYPYWLEFTVSNKPYDKNKFMAEIECEARWSL